jgi:hypothetical protein
MQVPVIVDTASAACTTDVAGNQLVADIVVAAGAGLSVDNYCALRAVGATHNEAVEVCVKTYQVPGYLAARAAGITHDQALIALRCDMALVEVAEAARIGCDFPTLYQMCGDGNARVGSVMRLWGAGAGVEKISWMLWRYPRSVNHYLKLRGCGVTWREVRAVVLRGGDVDVYLEMRKAGSAHRKAQRTSVASNKFWTQWDTTRLP